MKNSMLLRPAQVAERLGVSRGTLLKMERNGTLPPRIRLSERVSGWTQRQIDELLGLAPVLQFDAQRNVETR